MQTVRDTKGYSVLGASIDGREVCGAKLYSGEDVIQLPARMRVETLREEGCLAKFMEGSIEYLGWVILSRVRQMSSGCVLIPLHKNLSRSELAAALRKKSLAQYAWFMSKVVMTTLAVSAFIGMFSAGCAESGVKIVVGSCCFAIAALVAWNVAYRKFLKSEEWDVLFGGDRYGSCSRTQYESSINIMGEGK